MKGKISKVSGIVLLLGVFITSSVFASDVGPVEPLSPVPVIESYEMVDETPSAWFVEFRSLPLAAGGTIKQIKAEKDNFSKAAAKEKIEFTQRYEFNTLWNGISIAIKPSQLNRLSTLPGVVGVYPVEVISIPENFESPSPELYTALAMTGADTVQSELGYSGKGIKVAIMDTGTDYDHPDLGGCFGPGCRVYTGWDFVGDAFNADSASPSYNPVPTPDPYPDDCNGHGTHVSGIVGANGTVVGVAPEVSFGAYRVFGCEGSTTAEIMMMAMEQALKDKMDILNMSIGSAFTWPQYPTAKAADLLVDKGMVVVASIGNSGANGLYAAGAPGLGEKVIGVASFDNSHVFLNYFEVNTQKIGYLPMTFSGPIPTSGSEEIVYIGRACIADTLLADPAGKIALAVRGTCSFGEKALKAFQAGAVGVVIYNNVPGVVNGTLGAPLAGYEHLPVVGISQADGMFIQAQAAPITMTWTDQLDSFVSPTGGLISSFSSYGLSPDLTLKPDIGAPGGNIYSTYPLEKGGYATMGGTSMSSPHVAGAVALLLEAKPGMKAYEIRDVLQNSADPKVWWGNPGLGFLDNVHRQGAGMLDIDDAILATTRILPGKISAGEGEIGPFSQTLLITNNSKQDVTYDLTFVNALSTGGVIAPSFYGSDAFVTFESPIITVRSNKTVKLNLTITPATGPVNAQYGGYIELTPQGGGQVYRVPFAGFVGDYQGIQAVTPTLYGFPWLSLLYEGSYYQFTEPGDWVYSMQGDDVPYLLVHFDHQVEVFRVEIIQAMSGQLIHPVFNAAIYEEYLPRNSTATGFFAFAWDGTRLQSNGYNGVGYSQDLTIPVPDGMYKLVIKALKANGDANNPDHWEIWESPEFEIDRP
ncbi:MAG: S8 family serine peptidase [Anaerolineaceae bacterium]|nr:S8 family serine peptidase [Anaerolineaceae bacterium]